MVNDSAESFTNLVYLPCETCLSCEVGYEWDSDFINSPYKSQHGALFNLTLKMSENGAFFSVDPFRFGVSRK